MHRYFVQFRPLGLDRRLALVTLLYIIYHLYSKPKCHLLMSSIYIIVVTCSLPLCKPISYTTRFSFCQVYHVCTTTAPTHNGHIYKEKNNYQANTVSTTYILVYISRSNISSCKLIVCYTICEGWFSVILAIIVGNYGI